jgi:hypothetical protein
MVTPPFNWFLPFLLRGLKAFPQPTSGNDPMQADSTIEKDREIQSRCFWSPMQSNTGMGI